MNAITRLPGNGHRLFGEFDSLVNDFFAPARMARMAEAGGINLPALDITETATEYVVKADLPGIGKDNVSVSVKDKALIIETRVEEDNVVRDGETVIKRERLSGNYQRTLSLGSGVDAEKITADYADGVLTVTVPKAEEAKRRSIEVQVH